VYGQVGAGSSADNLLVPTRATSELSFTHLCAGESHNCALATDGSVHCWGQNDDGELGLAGDLAPRNVPTRVSALDGRSWRGVACGSFHSCALSTEGAVFCWGGNQRGNLGRGGGLADDSVPEPIQSALAFATLACSGSHCCATEEGTNRAFCWGGNTDGEVGDGTTFDAVPVPKWIAPGMRFTGFGLGARHSCGIDDGGSLHCWGCNTDGQLGVGDTAQRLVPSRVCFP
jgi:alpha-tubulin suppressor-like RCC1 family protein